MEEWKVRQEIYHRLKTAHSDDLADKQVVETKDVVKDAIRYFQERDIGWLYPSKSYMVGICYARWLSEYFGGRALEYLEDPDLLFGNDPYFVQYSTDPGTYHRILLSIGGWEFDTQAGMVPDVYGYFCEEFMIKEMQ